MTLPELAGDGTLPPLELADLPTGLSDLDALTHGLLPGALWVIAATPGAGRTTIACQLARQAAATGRSAALVSGRGGRREVLTNLLAAEARVPAQHLQRATYTDVEKDRLVSAASRLSEAELRLLSPADKVWVHSDGEGAADFRGLMRGGRRVADLLIADDADLLLGGDWIGAVPSLRRWSRGANFALVVTVPAEGVADAARCHPDLRRHADVVVRLELPGQFGPAGPRAGEADLNVLRNRHGPQGRVVVQFQGHYRCFADM